MPDSGLLEVCLGFAGGALITYELLKNGERRRGLGEKLEETGVDYLNSISSRFSENVSEEYVSGRDDYTELLEESMDGMPEGTFESMREEILEEDRELAAAELGSRDPKEIDYLEEHRAAEGY